ncbi:hypothetical protein KQI69_00025 [Eubacterium sp. MSJ-13]|uniref:hypothetical protein n=1 Tax=Eubacterium sp. MSJ-13 TaxID=2841513 RepID=UPI001C1007DC|nr:hypothetical protein [Eubacterium sp. MSJ-13]MBU5477590.1 hypothetical protein [Eubacterium sp. MSJ-13]
MFKIYSIGSGLGDCFFIEIGEQTMPIRILVDGRDGTQTDEIITRLEEIEKSDDKKIDIMIVTHIDQDHIKGIIELMKKRPEMFEQTIVIYNYVTKDVISYSQAEEFEEKIKNHTVFSSAKQKYPDILGSKIEIISKGESKDFYNQIEELQKEIPILILLSPDKNGIDSVYEEYKIKRSKDKRGSAVKINRNSIVFLIEYKDKCALFAGDAYIKHIDKILSSLGENLNKKVIDIIKMPHHGAEKNNKGIVDFANKHKCSKFIVTGEDDWKGIHPHKGIINEITKKIIDFVIYAKMDIKDDQISVKAESDEEIEI